MQPKRSMLALLLWVVLFYVAPVQALLRDAFTPVVWALPTFGLAGLPDPWIMRANPGLALALVAAYVGIYLLIALALRVCQAYHCEGAVSRLASLTTVKGLRGLDNLLLALLPIGGLGFILAAPFWQSEAVAVLAVVTWFVMLGMKRSKAGPRPEPPRTRDGDASGPKRTDASAEEDGSEIVKRYSWRFPDRVGARLDAAASEFTVELPISRERYQEFRARPRETDTQQWGSYVVAEMPEVDELASTMGNLGRTRGFRSYEQASNALAFTQQCIRYAQDISPDTGQLVEYPKYPIESLMEEAGDCEDQAILAAAMLKRMGYDVALLVCPGHAAVGIAGSEGLPGTYFMDEATGLRYFYGETTSDGWLLGELPEGMGRHRMSNQMRVIPVIMKASTPSGGHGHS